MNKKQIARISIELLSMFAVSQGILLFIDHRAFFSLSSWSYGTLFGTMVGMVMIYGHRYLGRAIKKRVSWIEAPIKSAVITFVSGTVFTLVTVCLMNYIFWMRVFDVSLKSFIDVNWFAIKLAFWMYLGASFVSYTIVFYIKWKNLVLEQEKQKSETLRLRFEALRNHVNPHFLFNSLASLVQLIRTDPDKAVEFTNGLSDIYRHILDMKDRDLIPLPDEMKLVDAYLQLQQIRYGNLVSIHNRVPTVVGRWQVIPLSVQMTVENVFKHNIVSRESKICIELWVENNFLYVKNNMNIKECCDDREPTGLANVRARYSYLANRECVFGRQGTDFVVALPLLENTAEVKGGAGDGG